MQKCNLPIEEAQEPDEEACQPQHERSASSPTMEKQKKSRITFAEPSKSSEQSSPQSRTTTCKIELSQPASNLTQRQRLIWLQSRRTTGLWSQCDDCHRWRYLPNVLDSHELPRKWYCKMNPDSNNADCSIPEAPLRLREEEDLIHSEYSAGSVVWARMPGWPWWPAMVDDCPDTEQYYWLDGFSDIPTHYNVVFFDAVDATRGWIAPNQLKPYGPNKSAQKDLMKDKRYRRRLEVAIRQADDADKLPLINRLSKYSFLTRYQGPINNPRKFSKDELKKFQNRLKRRYNIDFPDECSSESDEGTYDLDSNSKKKEIIRSNVILLGTPKKTKKARKVIKKNKIIIMSDANNKGTELDNSTGNETEPNIDKTVNETDESMFFKQPNSLAVQIGNTAPSTFIEPFDNDTSKTYQPESESVTESVSTTMNETVKGIITRIASPSTDSRDSVNFDF